MHDRFSGGAGPSPMILRARPVYFLLARPTQDVDRMPSTIGEWDVFDSEAQALDALDIHYAWCAVRHGGHALADTAQWYLQSAMVGPRINPGLGEVYLATADHDTDEVWAAAGGFLTEGEVVHWAPFVQAVRPRVRTATGGGLELAYRGDTDVHFGQVWFAPMHSTRVYPKRIVVDTV
ncbi:hypothetical protein GYA93_04590 [Gordonia desulfuricans]|uniref:Uncharacterized protein n=2 Tax=Gordonia TaxID=2053 RepID=A0A7K3LMV2_9ACTN|nr:hypothetical protein ISGA_3841 [Gordonia sp. NB41Y]NDK88857.1 hypothetical protein [Gordonia desulfuricans]